MAWIFDNEIGQRVWVPDEFVEDAGDGSSTFANPYVKQAAANVRITPDDPEGADKVRAELERITPNRFLTSEATAGGPGTVGRSSEFSDFYQQFLERPEWAPLYGEQGFLAPPQIGEGMGGVNQLLSPQDPAAQPGFAESRGAFEQAHPGFAQIGNLMLGVGDDGTPVFKGREQGPGPYVVNPEQVVYDPQYGLIAPLSSLGTRGKSGGFFRDSFGQGLLTLAAAAAPFVGAAAAGAPIGGAAGFQPATGSVVKGAALGSGISAATGGNPVAGAIQGMGLPAAQHAAGAVVNNLGLEPGMLADVAKGSIGGAIKGVGGGPQGILTGAVTGGVGGAVNTAADTLQGAIDDIDLQGIQASTNTPPTEQLFLPGSSVMTEGFLGAPSEEAALSALSDAGFDPLQGMLEGVTYFQGVPIDPNTGLAIPGGTPLAGAPVSQDFEGTFTPEQEALAQTEAETGELAGADGSGLNVKQVLNYGQLAKKIADIYRAVKGGSGTVDQLQLPEQGELSDEEYFTQIGDQVINYLGLDPQAIRQAGFTPGTPEYLNYILQQADSVIGQLFGGDPSALRGGESVDDLRSSLRNFTQDEYQQLQRALYARGALGQLGFAQHGADPFTGMLEEFGLSPGESVSPSIAAWQRGLARMTQDLAQKRGVEARDFLGDTMGRKSDLFNLQSTRDAEKLRAMLAARAQEEEDSLPLGEVGFGNEGFWQRVLEGQNPQLLEMLLSQISPDTSRQGAAIESLFGRAI
jgi:hypothetical protein